MLEFARSLLVVSPFQLREQADAPTQYHGLSTTRQNLLALVRADPGATISDLRARLGMGWGAFYHHLHHLGKLGLIETLTQGRRCLVYPPGHAALRHSLARSVLRGPTARGIALAILREPRGTVRQLVATQRCSERVVYYHVRRLLDAGLVTSPPGARLRDLVGTPQLELLLGESEAPPTRPAAVRRLRPERP